MDQLYVEEGYNEPGYTVYTAEAVTTSETGSEVVMLAGLLQESAEILSAVSELSSYTNYTTNAVSELASTFELTAIGSKIMQGNALFDLTFESTLDYIRIRDFDVLIDSAMTADMTVTLIKIGEILLAVNSSLELQGTIVKDNSIVLNSLSELEIDYEVVIDLVANLSVQTNLQAILSKLAAKRVIYVIQKENRSYQIKGE